MVVIVLMIAAAAVVLLLIGQAIPYLRGAVVLVEDAEHTHGTNVSNQNNASACGR